MAKKKSSNSSLIVSLLYIIVGILLAVFPGEALNIAMTVAGVIFLISGIIELVRQNWVGGIISLVIGIAILVMGWLVSLALSSLPLMTMSSPSSNSMGMSQ